MCAGGKFVTCTYSVCAGIEVETVIIFSVYSDRNICLIPDIRNIPCKFMRSIIQVYFINTEVNNRPIAGYIKNYSYCFIITSAFIICANNNCMGPGGKFVICSYSVCSRIEVETVIISSVYSNLNICLIPDIRNIPCKFMRCIIQVYFIYTEVNNRRIAGYIKNYSYRFSIPATFINSANNNCMCPGGKVVICTYSVCCGIEVENIIIFSVYRDRNICLIPDIRNIPCKFMRCIIQVYFF